MESKQGISYTEFTYQLLQAYDFYKLHTLHGCNIQLGGSDQWGNVIAGLELINRLGGATPGHDTDREETAFGITTPLLTTASGEKFGKSAGNAVWLNDRLTSVFDFYQVMDVVYHTRVLVAHPQKKVFHPHNGPGRRAISKNVHTDTYDNDTRCHAKSSRLFTCHLSP
jgi:tyrosyl-tRNA synthetase